ncbi:hypothetical protein [Amycolatopsis sp. CA-230715]|uniref:hypothetical protein n=1 Tax=Amycolatopsis sp. CA-230715 TaxID=2745196 RepID=UPI001C01EDB7|nr:hypothetical protein [Amycolatopsis sp. CA-230715]QWF84915.1 hypothetical protein HUW46_08367 [Amycolatopsis sp. CA-230715]
MTDELATLCSALPRLRRSFRGAASAEIRAVVEQAALAARRGEPVSDFLVRLGLGDDEDGQPSRGLPTSLPSASFEPVTGVHVCPAGTCGRVETRSAGGEPPQCHLFEQTLRFVAD